MAMPKPPRTLLLASLAVGAAACGAALAFLALAGPFDPRAAAGGVLAAAALSASLLALAWARRRALARPVAAPRAATEASRAGLAVVPLGGGEAAVIFDEPRAAGRDAAPGPDPGPRRDAAAAADAIWDAVDAAVRDAARPAAGNDPPAPGAQSLLDRARRRLRPGPGPGPGDDSR